MINIGNQNNFVTINDLARIILEILNLDEDERITYNPDFDNSDRDKGREIFQRRPDTSKAKLLLGFEAEIGLEEAIKKVIKYGSFNESWPED